MPEHHACESDLTSETRHGSITVMTFGTFDIVHPGHAHYLATAKKLGDKLITIVATDKNVLKIKGRAPFHNENKRRTDVEALGISDIVEIGNEANPYLCIEKYLPDIICLGYDQQWFADGLSKSLQAISPKTRIVRLEAFEPDTHKSSKLRPANNDTRH